MGQQQLLLLVMTIVIVAFATLAALTAWDTYMRKDESDALLNRSLTIATSAVYWKTKSDPFAGGDASYLRLATEGLNLLGLDTTDGRGRYRITSATANQVQITGVSIDKPEIAVRVTISEYEITNTQLAFQGEITF